MSDRVLQFRVWLAKIQTIFSTNIALPKYCFKRKIRGSSNSFKQCLAKPDWMMSALFLAKTYLALENKPLAIKHLELTKKLASNMMTPFMKRMIYSLNWVINHGLFWVKGFCLWAKSSNYMKNFWGFSVVSGATMCSRVLGLVRDILFFATFSIYIW